jgi:phosphatidate cytidylyltransferase
VLKTRVYTVMVVLPLFAAALFYLPSGGWALFLTPMMLVGAWEWGVLAGWRVAGRAAFVCATALGGAVLWHFGGGGGAGVRWLYPALFGASVFFWFVVAPLWLAKGWRVQSPLMMALAGALLILPLWCALIQLQARPSQLLMLMAVVWISDTAAYLCGRRWGRRKLAVTISPGKTWEGVFGAMAGVALYYALVSAAGVVDYPILQGLGGFAIFLALAVLGIEGDLFESWIKRTAGIKDSGGFFPGHGGVLDRVDALTSSMPAAALLLSGAA